MPQLLLRVFALSAIVLVPWIIFTAQYLPTKHLDRNWDVAWTGFDVGLLISMAATAYFGIRKSGWVVLASSAAGTLLMVDAWFDCLTASYGFDKLISVSTATFFEIPLALLAYWLAYHSGKYYFKR